jgi:hypothetical protein
VSKIAREPRRFAPCDVLGEVVNETERRVTYRRRDGKVVFLSRRWGVHTEPCPHCLDAEKQKFGSNAQVRPTARRD